MIKKLLTCCTAGILCSIHTPAQTLFTYGPKAVSQSEFTKAFEKNPEPGDRRKALENYLPLFINYKLKVQDALDKKMDTLPNQQAELENYRLQLADNYINAKANTKSLVHEAFERSQKDILLGHLFIGFNTQDSNSIKAAAQQANQAKAALTAGQDFAAVVNRYSTDAAAKTSGGQAGWITVFSIPYLYESAVYELPVGGYSQVYKSASGFHIFKKIAERPAEGRVKIAQIMLVNTDTTNPANEEKIKQRADSLYQALQKGTSFDNLAAEFSNDRTSYDNGGLLPEFGVGSYAPSFESQAFALKNKGDISKPFRTIYGWHILKLVDKTPVATTLENADENNQLTEKVLNSGRAATARNVYLESALPKLGFRQAAFNEKDLWRFTDSAITSGNTKGQKITGKTVLFSFTNTPVTADEWVQYVKTTTFAPGAAKAYPDLFKGFVVVKEQQYLQKNLQKIDPDYAQQYKEFKDANLLFEAMDKNVWNKASADTAGLSAYYKRNKGKYRWGASADAILITCTDSAIVNEVYGFVKSNPASWRELQEKFVTNVIVDSGRYELTQLPVTNSDKIETSMLTTPVKNELDKSQTFAYILKTLPPGDERDFEDAKGFVINDYQQVLESQWLTALKRKYPIKINQPAWNKLLASLK